MLDVAPLDLIKRNLHGQGRAPPRKGIGHRSVEESSTAPATAAWSCLSPVHSTLPEPHSPGAAPSRDDDQGPQMGSKHPLVGLHIIRAHRALFGALAANAARAGSGRSPSSPCSPLRCSGQSHASAPSRSGPHLSCVPPHHSATHQPSPQGRRRGCHPSWSR